MKSYDELTIEPFNDGHFQVVAHGEYEESSVLAGQYQRAVLDIFATLEEAQAQYPAADVRQFATRTTAAVPYEPEAWFDPGDAGEAWGSDDY